MEHMKKFHKMEVIIVLPLNWLRIFTFPGGRLAVWPVRLHNFWEREACEPPYQPARQVRRADTEFVQNFTPPDFQAKNFTPSISPNFNSFSKKKHKNEWKWRNLHHWQKFYTAAGTDGTDKFHLCELLYLNKRTLHFGYAVLFSSVSYKLYDVLSYPG